MNPLELFLLIVAADLVAMLLFLLLLLMVCAWLDSRKEANRGQRT